MAGQEPQGFYALVSLLMVAVLAGDFIWVATTALQAMR
jgi:hypothetical protein